MAPYSQPQNLRWELGLANKLDILCYWVRFRLIIFLLLPLIAFNLEIGIMSFNLALMPGLLTYWWF
jgi:hypothetical protein